MGWTLGPTVGSYYGLSDTKRSGLGAIRFFLYADVILFFFGL
jgi:hypothetical protein